MNGAALRQWRLAHGLTVEDLQARLRCLPYQPRGIRAMEDGRLPITHGVAAYVATYPPPPQVPTYPPTAAGLDAAIRARWPTLQAWAAWWGCSQSAQWQWRRGRCPLPPDVYRWLWEGAPFPWQPEYPPPLTACLVCGDTPLHGRGRCQACYAYLWRTHRDRSPLLLRPDMQPPCRVCGGPSQPQRVAWCHRCYIRAWRQRRARDATRAPGRAAVESA